MKNFILGLFLVAIFNACGDSTSEVAVDVCTETPDLQECQVNTDQEDKTEMTDENL